LERRDRTTKDIEDAQVIDSRRLQKGDKPQKRRTVSYSALGAEPPSFS
jgi:hypothetical protein